MDDVVDEIREISLFRPDCLYWYEMMPGYKPSETELVRRRGR